MENWQANKTNHLIAAVLIALLTSCGSSGGKSGDDGKNPEPTPVDAVPNPEQEPSAPSEPLIKDEKTVAHIEAQFANDGEKHAAAVLAADTLELAAAKTPDDVQNIAHHQVLNLLCYAYTVKTAERQIKAEALTEVVLSTPELKAAYHANYAQLNGTLMSIPDKFLNGETCVDDADSKSGVDLLFGGSSHWNDPPKKDPLVIDAVKYTLGPNCDKKHEGTVVVFGNGVGNSWDAAVIGLSEIVRRVETEKRSRPELNNLRYCIAHNSSRDYFVHDGAETLKQKTIEAMLEDQTDHSLKGEALVKERKTKLDAILAEHGTVSMVSDLKKHIATYQNRIKLSDGVVVLAHSQGSLFANMAMHGIEYAQRPSIAQVFIGPAAGLIYDHAREDFVSDTGRWTRFENDRIIWAAEVWHRDQADVKCIFTGRVVVCNGRDITIAPLTATVGHSNSLFSDNHKLVESYLAVDASRERIMTHLVEAVKIVRKKPAPAPALDNLIVDINWTATTGSPQMHLNVLEPADVAGNPDVQVYDKFINGRGTMVEAGQNGKQRYELKCKDTPDGTSNFKIGFHTGYFTVPNSKIAFNIAIAVDGGDGKSSEATNADTGSISKVRSLYEVAVTRKDGKCTFTVTQPTVTHWNL